MLSRRKIREKRRENALLATSNYRSFGYQINGKQNSSEIANNHTVHEIYIVKQQV